MCLVIEVAEHPKQQKKMRKEKSKRTEHTNEHVMERCAGEEYVLHISSCVEGNIRFEDAKPLFHDTKSAFWVYV